MLDEVFSTFSDATVYFIMGAVGTLLFIVKMAMMLVFGADGGGDFDLEAGGEGDAHGGDFNLFSLLSIISFMMGAGWLGLAARLDWGWGSIPSAAAASGFGFALMLFSSMTMWQMRKFNAEGRYDAKRTVGHIGRVYLTIPPQGQGTGQVEMNVDGRRAILTAKSSGDQIESFAAVKVLEVQDGDIVLVEQIR